MTNAVVHAAPPVELRLRRTADELVIEVYDGAASCRASAARARGRERPRPAARRHAAVRWGTRPLQDGKAVGACSPAR
jgi:hypothetical protein